MSKKVKSLHALNWMYGNKRKSKLDKLIEEALLDTYNEDEAYSGFLAMIQDNVKVPFFATVVGTPVRVIDFDGNRRQIVARCEGKNGGQYKIDILELEGLSKIVGIEWIKAYRKWSNDL